MSPRFQVKFFKTSPYPDMPDVSVELGFWEWYNDLLPGVAAALQAAAVKYGVYSVAVTGHSAGASCATLHAFDLARGANATAGFSLAQVVTFGSPRTGNEAFYSAHAALVSPSVYAQWRVTHYRDMVLSPQLIIDNDIVISRIKNIYAKQPASLSTVAFFLLALFDRCLTCPKRRWATTTSRRKCSTTSPRRRTKCATAAAKTQTAPTAARRFTAPAWMTTSTTLTRPWAGITADKSKRKNVPVAAKCEETGTGEFKGMPLNSFFWLLVRRLGRAARKAFPIGACSDNYDKSRRRIGELFRVAWVNGKRQILWR